MALMKILLWLSQLSTSESIDDASDDEEDNAEEADADGDLAEGPPAKKKRVRKPRGNPVPVEARAAHNRHYVKKLTKDVRDSEFEQMHAGSDTLMGFKVLCCLMTNASLFVSV